MKFKKKYLSNFFLVLFLVILIIYIKNNKEEFAELRNINLWFLLMAMIIRTAQLFLSGYFIKIIVNKYLEQKSISSFESFYISVFSAVGNFFGFLQSGIGIRAFYLKTKYGLSISKFTMTVVIHYTITFFVFGTAGLLALICLGSYEWKLIVPLFFLSYAAIGFILLNRIKIVERIVFSNVFRRLHNAFRLLREIPEDVKTKPQMYLSLSLLYILRFLLAMLIQFLFFKSLDLMVPFCALMLYTSISRLPLIINITPAGVGFREAILILIQGLILIDTTSILKLAIVERTIFVVVLSLSFLVTSIIKKLKFAE
jgi:uncharacterized protein (TIRG00374 family)